MQTLLVSEWHGNSAELGAKPNLTGGQRVEPTIWDIKFNGGEVAKKRKIENVNYFFSVIT